jgi:DNA-directed RNA polymerase beta' subunit
MRTEESGPFGKASFEETLDNFLKAGVFGQEEQTRGVSASIICGKIAPIGTGMCDLAIDVAKLATIQEDDEIDE